MTDVPRWQERIGGRWAISWQSYVVGVTLNTAILALTGGQIGASEVAPADIPAWIGIGLLSSAAVGIWALIADGSFMRDRRRMPVPAWMAIGFHLVVGLIFGAIVVLVGDALIEPSPQPQAERIVVIALIGLWWGLTAALVLEARERFAREREGLIDEAVQLELASIDEAETASRLRSAIERDVGDAFDGVRSDVGKVLAELETPASALLPLEEWWRISASLRDTAEATVRPLSHRLWEATEARYPRPRLGRVLTRLVLYQSFAPFPTMTILAIGYLPAGSFRFGLGWGIVATLVMAGLAGGLLAAANAVMARALRAHAAIFLGTFLLTQVYAVAYLAALDAIAGVPFIWSAEVLGGLIAVGNSVLLPAAVASLNGTREELLERFRADTDSARVRQLASARQLASVTRAAARELHGTVQTRLISCAVAIEQASRSGDVAQFRRALETSIAILDAPFPGGTADLSATVPQEIARMCAPWEGLCAFAVAVDERAAGIRGPMAMAAGRVVEEAVANACRHGLATDIRIGASVTLDDGRSLLRVVVDDDGSGPAGGGPGLGTAMLAGISGGRVRLEPGATSGARLTVDLPLDLPLHQTRG